MIIKSTIAWLRVYGDLVRRLPKATEFIFAARSPAGRSVKIFLFGVGVVLPLGSLIWMLLFWHGNALGRVIGGGRSLEPTPSLPARTDEA